jgi:predicted aspartyl protease
VPIEFPLAQKRSPFGLISDPKISITIDTLDGPRTYRFLVDTGADFSLAPRRLAEEVGLAWDRMSEAHVVGVEQGGLRARLGPLPIKLETVDMTVRCLFVDSPAGPFILGRADFLDRFVLTIDSRRRRIILDENSET